MRTVREPQGEGAVSPVVAAIAARQLRIDGAYRGFIHHVRQCETCLQGVNCPEGEQLQQAWCEARGVNSAR